MCVYATATCGVLTNSLSTVVNNVQPIDWKILAKGLYGIRFLKNQTVFIRMLCSSVAVENASGSRSQEMGD